MQIGTCRYCGTQQTIPSEDDDRILNLYASANAARMRGEYDQASAVYSTIIAYPGTHADAHWGKLLCTYGITYVDDMNANDKVPTLNRLSYDSVLNDQDYLAALDEADILSREYYEKEGNRLESIREGAVEISSNERPYDVFISYKEKDDLTGGRTPDSIIGQRVYEALIARGYRVFYSRETLKSVMGEKYEPYIFNALRTARVMLLIGTRKQYVEAPWVRNEWSRYLTIMKGDPSRKLIPCYQTMDPGELPNELKMLQAVNMEPIDAVHNLVVQLNRIAPPNATSGVGVSAAMGSSNDDSKAMPGVSAGVNQLVQRGDLALADANWQKAKGFFDRALDIDPKFSGAYLGEFLATQEKASLEELHGKFRNELKTAEAHEETLHLTQDSAWITALRSKYSDLWKLSDDEVDGICSKDRTCRNRSKSLSAIKAKAENTFRTTSWRHAVQFADPTVASGLTSEEASIMNMIDREIEKDEDATNAIKDKMLAEARSPEEQAKIETVYETVARSYYVSEQTTTVTNSKVEALSGQVSKLNVGSKPSFKWPGFIMFVAGVLCIVQIVYLCNDYWVNPLQLFQAVISNPDGLSAAIGFAVFFVAALLICVFLWRFISYFIAKGKWSKKTHLDSSLKKAKEKQTKVDQAANEAMELRKNIVAVDTDSEELDKLVLQLQTKTNEQMKLVPIPKK